MDKIIIDLDGEEGNAFCIMGYAIKFLRKLGHDKNYIDNFTYEMRKGDYNNLIRVFYNEFVYLVELKTNQDSLKSIINSIHNAEEF